MLEPAPDYLPAAATPPTSTVASHDPAVEIFHPDGQAPVLLVCDHAGRRIPPPLGDLGLPEAELVRHIGWDIGAADVTRHLARVLDAPAVLDHVSRLVIDPNREPGSPSSIPEISDGTLVPGNCNLDQAECKRRLRDHFLPYHRTVARQIARLRRRVGIPAIISMHSFTPRIGHNWRPWQVAVLWDQDRRLAKPVLDALSRQDDLTVGDNVPYSGAYPIGYSVPFHAARNRFPHVSFEVRQDLIETLEEAQHWAERLADALRGPLADPGLYRRLAG